MLSQTGEHGGGNASVLRLYRDILRNEGVVGLWAGNGANLLRVFPAKAVVFSSNDFYRQLIQRFVTGEEKGLNVGWSFLAGGMAGMSASLATYPLDLAVSSNKNEIAASIDRHSREVSHNVIGKRVSNA